MTPERDVLAPGVADPVEAENLALQVEDLSVEFVIDDHWVRVVDEVSLTVMTGEVLGLVGESGAGKSVASQAIMGLIPERTGRVTVGSVVVGGRRLPDLSARSLQGVRGRDAAMIFQEPTRSLNPAFTIGDQIAEMGRTHMDMSRSEAMARATEMLELVHIPNPRRRFSAYPHEMSGGMCQRIMLAMALMCHPRLLIADEPTTALDVTVQARVLDLLKEIQEETGVGILIITHDLAVIADIADRVAVMYAGQVVDSGPVEDVFDRPLHPYTEGLLLSIPSLIESAEAMKPIPGSVPPPDAWPNGCRFHPRCMHCQQPRCTTGSPELVDISPSRSSRCVRVGELELHGPPPPGDDEILPGFNEVSDLPAPADVAVAEPRLEPTMPTDDLGHEALLDVTGLAKSFPSRRNVLGRVAEWTAAVQDVSFRVGRGETVALVGESGAGKSTIGRLVLRLTDPDAGSIGFAGSPVSDLSRPELRAWRRHAQMIFQDPFLSFDRKMTIGASVGEPLRVLTGLRGSELKSRVEALLDRVGIPASYTNRYPYEFSGGQLQRMSIARALSTNPQIVVCDEPVAALDMSIQAQVVNLLRELQAENGTAYLFITHDLSLVRLIAHRVVVLYRGRIVEQGPAEAIFTEPRDPYTRALLASVPVPYPRLQRSRTRGRIMEMSAAVLDET